MTAPETTAALPAPLVPAEVDLRDLPSFMFNTQKLFGSELWALTRTSPEAFRGAVALWCRAWHQVPAASLPEEETTLAAFAELPIARFRKLRLLLMRGFVHCTDGRYYHRVLAEEAMRAWERKVKYLAKREVDRRRLENWRETKRNCRDETPEETSEETSDETNDETNDETRFTHASTSTRTNTSSSLRSEESHTPPDTANDQVSPTLGERAAARESLIADFTAWWAQYPRKISKGTAERAYTLARKHVDAATLLAGVMRYAQERAGEDPKYTKHAATWLNGRCWLDEPATRGMNGPNKSPGVAGHRSDPVASLLAGAARALDRGRL